MVLRRTQLYEQRHEKNATMRINQHCEWINENKKLRSFKSNKYIKEKGCPVSSSKGFSPEQYVYIDDGGTATMYKSKGSLGLISRKANIIVRFHCEIMKSIKLKQMHFFSVGRLSAEYGWYSSSCIISRIS